MKNREFYGEKIISTLGTHGICKVMSDLVFPFYREKYQTAVACDNDCATCTAMFTMWLGEKAKYQATNLSTEDSLVKTTPVIDECPASVNPKPEPIFDPDECVKDAPTVNFHKGAFEGGDVGIRCNNYEDAVSLCHILKNMGYKGADLDSPEDYVPGGFYIYNEHEKCVFLFDASFIPYFEGTTGAKVDEEFILLNYKDINFLPTSSISKFDACKTDRTAANKVADNKPEVSIEEIIKSLTEPLGIYVI